MMAKRGPRIGGRSPATRPAVAFLVTYGILALARDVAAVALRRHKARPS